MDYHSTGSNMGFPNLGHGTEKVFEIKFKDKRKLQFIFPDSRISRHRNIHVGMVSGGVFYRWRVFSSVLMANNHGWTVHMSILSESIYYNLTECKRTPRHG